jgi:hypothetical protein
MKTIAEKNVLIAEFTGVYTSENGYDYSLIGNKGVAYHRSWDWLMPIVEEIGLRNHIDKAYMGVVTIHGLNRTSIQCYHNEMLAKTIDISGVSGIEPTYKAVLEFIEWYNQSKNAPQTEPAKEKVHQLTPQEFIEKYHKELERALRHISKAYLLRKDIVPTSDSLYSPRWYNIEDIVETIEDDMEAPLRVSFKSTQGPMYFSITVPREGMEVLQHLSMDLWEPFKRFRTKFLEENYPTIQRY